MSTRLTILLLLVLIATPQILQAETPTGWRTDASGRYPAAQAVSKWSQSDNVIWKTSMPSWSNSTPASHGDLLFICAEPNLLLCLRRSDGKILWKRAFSIEDKPSTHRTNGFTSATPTTDGKRVYVSYGTGDIACYSVKGKLEWNKFVDKPTHRWGHSSSPTLAAGKLVAHVANTLAAYDAVTGKQLWKTRSRMAWGSPVHTRVGQLDILVLANGSVVRLSDGKQLASGLGRLTYASPIINDGVAYFIEHRSTAVKLTPDGNGGIKTEQLWSQTLQRRRSRYYASAVLHDGRVYALEQRNNLAVLDAKSGEIVYEKRLSALGRGTCYPSLTLAGKLLLASNDNGTTIVFSPGASFKQIALNRLDRFRSCPMFVGSRMYVRTYEALYCIGQGKQQPGDKPKPKKQKKVDFYE